MQPRRVYRRVSLLTTQDEIEALKGYLSEQSGASEYISSEERHPRSARLHRLKSIRRDGWAPSLLEGILVQVDVVAQTMMLFSTIGISATSL